MRGYSIGFVFGTNKKSSITAATALESVMMSLLHNVNAEHGTTVLFVTHNPALAQRCDRTIEVVDGRVTGAEAGRE